MKAKNGPFKRKYLLYFFFAQSVILLLSNLGFGYNIWHFLFYSGGRFDDFISGIVHSPVYFSPALEWDPGFSQVASPVSVAYYDFWRLFVNDYRGVVIALFLMWLLYFSILLKMTRDWFLTFFLLVTYPIMFLFGRGNPDIFAHIILCISIIALQRNKTFVFQILIGCIASMKFPYLLIGFSIVLVSKGIRNACKQIIVLLSSTAFFFVTPLLLKPWSIIEQIRIFRLIVERYFSDYIIGDAGTLFNNSLFGLFKALSYLLFGRSRFDSPIDAREFSNTLNQLYVPFVVIFVLSLIIFYLLRSRGFAPISNVLNAEMILLSVLVIIWFPQISADYRLALLVPATAFLYMQKSKFLSSRFFNLTIAFLFLPKHFIYWNFTFHEAGITLNTLLNSLALGAITVYTVLKIVNSSNDTGTKPAISK